MNRRLVSLIAILALTTLALPMLAGAQEASAQEATAEAARQLTLTEDQINQSFRVTNPARRGISDVAVDLQPDQVSVSYVVTRRAPQGRETTRYDVTTVIVPEIRNGRLYWSVSSVTIDGQPASDEFLEQINTSVESAWRNYVRRQMRAGRLHEVSISDTALTLTLNG